MALVKGLGSCLIAKENGYPCGRQIQEGEPIGTVVVGHPGNPIVGHKACADAFNKRKQEATVKTGKQQGPGGSIGDPQAYDDALAFGSFPLEKPESAHPAPELDQVRMPEGVKPLSELPFEEETVSPQVAQYVTGNSPLSDEDREIEAVRAKHAKMRNAEPVTHVITVDMSAVPDNVQRLQINLDWPV